MCKAINFLKGKVVNAQVYTSQLCPLNMYVFGLIFICMKTH